MDFEIEIVKQGWLDGTTAERDLCSHGDVRLTIGGQVVSAGDGSGDYGISEAALGLLRTLSSDHSPAHPVAERLIPHGCGTILMMGCPIGIDWSVSRTTGKVKVGDVVRFDGPSESDVVSFGGLEVEMSDDAYRRQIVAFASVAKEPFRDQAKVFEDAFDRKQYTEFWAEYDRRLAVAE